MELNSKHTGCCCTASMIAAGQHLPHICTNTRTSTCVRACTNTHACNKHVYTCVNVATSAARWHHASARHCHNGMRLYGTNLHARTHIRAHTHAHTHTDTHTHAHTHTHARKTNAPRPCAGPATQSQTPLASVTAWLQQRRRPRGCPHPICSGTIGRSPPRTCQCVCPEGGGEDGDDGEARGAAGKATVWSQRDVHWAG